jgi:hypothetical protein
MGADVPGFGDRLMNQVPILVPGPDPASDGPYNGVNAA